MRHFVIELNARFGFEQIVMVRADRYEIVGGIARFYREGRLVHQVPERYVAAIVEHENSRLAEDHVRDYRDHNRQARNFKSQEYGLVARPPRKGAPVVAGGGLVEGGLSIRVTELPTRRPSST